MNSTSVLENGTGASLQPGSSPGLAVGLSLFFIFLAVAVGVIGFALRGRIGTLVRSVRRRGPGKEASAESAQPDDNQYTSMSREPGRPQSPIYENLATQKAAGQRPAADQRRQPAPMEEDLYVQCDEMDDRIYSNDPEFSAKLPAASEDDDVYLMPES